MNLEAEDILRLSFETYALGIGRLFSKQMCKIIFESELANRITELGIVQKSCDGIFDPEALELRRDRRVAGFGLVFRSSTSIAKSCGQDG